MPVTPPVRTSPPSSWRPRLGTLSPWASKATDIAHNCGVDVRRVERVTEYLLATDEPLTEAAVGRPRPTCSTTG